MLINFFGKLNLVDLARIELATPRCPDGLWWANTVYVDQGRIELPTSSLQMRRSTTELLAHQSHTGLCFVTSLRFR